MPIPKPKKDEKKDDFLKRCMADKVMLKEYPDKAQRNAICNKQWDDKEKSERQKDKVWSKEKATSWLKKNDFKTGSYEKMANYHSFRQTDPKKYKSFRLEKAPFDFKENDGVIVVYGIYEKEGKRTSEVQSIRFYHGEKDKEEKKSIDRQVEIRTYPVELRVDDSEDKPKIRGYAAPFNQLSLDLGGFREQIKRGAFKKTIMESDIVATKNHDKNFILGRNKSGTLVLGEDRKGLSFEIDPPETTYARDLIISMQRGDINQCSFKFRVIADYWDSKDKDNIIRTLKEVELFDVAIVTSPAYSQTKAQYRSTEEVFKDFNESIKEKEEKEEHEVRKKKIKLAIRKIDIHLIKKELS